MLKNESFGFAPYIGPCKDTDNYQIVGACSDQLSSKQIKKARNGERSIKKTKYKKSGIPNESFLNYCKLRDFQEQQQQPQQVTSPEEIKQGQEEVPTEEKPKMWSGKKKEVLSYWKNLSKAVDNKESPILANPIPYKYKGSTYNKDGVRLTGSSTFINSVLPKLKDMISYEGKNSKLSLIYKEITPEEDLKIGNRSFALYIKTKERGPKAKERYGKA